METAFKELKQQLCETPFLCYPFNNEFTVVTDVSNDRIGGALSQKRVTRKL